MSDETQRATDYLLRALLASVREGQNAVATADLYHLGVILRRMRGDIGALAATLRDTQKEAPTRKRRRPRKAAGVSGVAVSPRAMEAAVETAAEATPPKPARAPRRRIIVAPEPAAE